MPGTKEGASLLGWIFNYIYYPYIVEFQSLFKEYK